MKLELESNTNALPVVDHSDVDEMIYDNNSAEVTQMLRDGIEAAQKGDRAEARTILLRVTEADAQNENAWLWLASISEYPEELLVFLKNVLSINPNNERAIEWAKATETLMAKTFVQRGIDAAKNEQRDLAKQCFLQAIVHDGQNELAWLWLASVSNSPEEKISHLQKVLSINPENENALSSLKNAKSQMAESLLPKANNAAIAGNREEALRLLDEILNDSPDFEDGWMLKAHLAESFEEKIAYFEQVLEVNPNNQVARANLDSLQMIVDNSASEDEEPEAEIEEMPEMKEDSADMAMGGQDLANAIAEEIHQEKVEEEPVQEVEQSVEAPQEVEMQEEKPQEVELKEEFEQFESQEDQPTEVEMREESQEPAETPVVDSEEKVEAESQDEEYQSEEENDPSYEAFEEVESEEESVVLEVEQPMEAPEEDFVSSEVNFEEVSQDYDSESEVQDVVEDYDLLDHSQVDEPVEESNDEVVEDFSVDSAPEQKVEEEIHSEEPTADYSMEDLSPQSEATEPESFEQESVESEPVDEKETVEEKPAQMEMAEPTPAQPQQEVMESPVSQPEMPQFEVAEQETITPEALEEKQPQMCECPFCYQENGYEALICVSCRSILTLSDIEMLLSQDKADKGFVEKAIERMEADKNRRGVDLEELKAMGIGYINLKQYRKGFDYLKDAAKKNPDDIVFNSQIDALAVRIAEIEEKEQEKEASPKSKTILVVDDSPTIRKLISGKLEKCGHEAICAVDGMDALAKINEVVPDLILLDITMPRMDGYQVCKLIRGNESTQNVPIVMISGKDGFFDKVRGKMAGTDNYITKPFGPETLMKTVNAYIS